MAIPLESKAASLLSLKLKPGPRWPYISLVWAFTDPLYLLYQDGRCGTWIGKRHLSPFAKEITHVASSLRHFLEISSFSSLGLHDACWLGLFFPRNTSTVLFLESQTNRSGFPVGMDLTNILPCAEPPIGKGSTTPARVPLLLYLTPSSSCCVWLYRQTTAVLLCKWNMYLCRPPNLFPALGLCHLLCSVVKVSWHDSFRAKQTLLGHSKWLSSDGTQSAEGWWCQHALGLSTFSYLRRKQN